MELYIVRHGQTEWNQKHILQGSLDSELTTKGIQGAKKIKEKLSDVSFCKVYTSQQRRAIITTEIILENKINKHYEIDPEVMEMGFGIWEGRTQEEISILPSEKQRYINYFKHPEKYEPIEGAESFEGIIKRAKDFLNKIKKASKDDDKVLLVTHGAFIKALFLVIKNHNINQFWEEPYVTNCSISIVDIKKDEIKIVSEVDVSHLGEHSASMKALDYLKQV